MDVTDAVTGRIELREFADEDVDDATKRAVAAFAAGRPAPRRVEEGPGRA